MSLKITKIQDDGGRFIIHGSGGLYAELDDIFAHIGMGIKVTESDRGAANILYTENNRDIVLRILYDHTDNPPVEDIDSRKQEA